MFVDLALCGLSCHAMPSDMIRPEGFDTTKRGADAASKQPRGGVTENDFSPKTLGVQALGPNPPSRYTT